MARAAAQMRSAIARIVLPVLAEAGFTGAYPHFRRAARDARRLDLVSIQTDKWGGGFLIEVATCPVKDIRDWAGRRVSPRVVTAQHMKTRTPLPKAITRRDWYRYDDLPDGDADADADADRFARVAGRALAHLERLGLVARGAPRSAGSRNAGSAARPSTAASRPRSGSRRRARRTA